MTRTTLTRLALTAVLLAAVVWALMHRNAFDTASLSAEIHRAGPWGALAFITIYALATIALLPGALLTLAGGALFGPVAGTFYNLTGATLGATGALLVSRYLAADWVRARLGHRSDQIITAVEREDWRFIVLVRLVPLIPFNLLNYALGLTRIRISRYILASYIAMLPGTLAYTYLGYAGRTALAGHADWIRNGLIALGLLACVAYLPRILRKTRTVIQSDAEE
jgi:uncharacterized membrane protein YdjX (TVP38/TMEM64 family)